MSIEQFTIYHMNDIHSTFTYWPQIVTYIKEERRNGVRQLVVDLGDHADRSHPFTEATMGKGNVELLNALKIDYATIGNNEGITFSKEQLEHLYDEANFPIIVGNLFEKNGSRPSWVKPYVIHSISEKVKVGFIGLTAPFSRFYEQLGWKISQPLEILKELVQEVKPQVDMIVLLSHLGLFRDEEIAEQFPDIQLILGAHTHHVLEHGKRQFGTLIAQAGKGGQFVGKVKVSFDTESRMIVEDSAEVREVKALQPDPETMARLNILKHKAKRKLAEPITVLSQGIDVSWEHVSQGGQLLCDALTEWCGVDLGMMNAGVLLESIPAGIVTKADIHRICPHPINPCVIQLNGQALQETIERAFTKEIRNLELKGFGFRGKMLGRMLFTGMDVTIEENLNGDAKITAVFVKGEPLKKEALYTIATLDMYTFGYLFPKIAEAKVKNYFMPEMLRDVLTWKLQQHHC
ncbi:bifunctional metallophosphatase/5'-nucleotidase [Halalkalibacterium ligniniphilum]|uniref:bifunctional metallophosphatase/5'-nucleotidase n=1 Tax=Halalkalibacterium ligniniphilum TaxID=1134413 RepID=UPI00034A5D38|nr:bifunctional UDP-sugar hydrolase/5'-nucleotidase [Halalkalibacterium ligniniphilum]